MIPHRIGHRDVLALAWPIIVSNLSTTALAVVNAIWVGQLGTAELGSIGLATTTMYLITAFPLGLLAAIRTQVATAVGAGDEAEARGFGWQGVWLALGLGALCMTLAPLTPALFPWLGASAEVVGPASSYAAVRLLTAPIALLVTALTSVGQGRGDTRTPMIASVLANVVNFVVDPVLVFGLGPLPALGVAGAALGTALGLLSALVVLLRASPAWLGPLVRPEGRLLRANWRLGAPQAVQYVLDVASFVVFGSLLAGAGDAQLAAHVVVVRIVMASFLPAHAIGEAVSVLVGQSLGGGRGARANAAARLGAIQVTSWMALTGVVLVTAPGLLVGVFGAEPEVVALVKPVLRLYAVIQVLDGLAVVGFGALAGAGDTGFAMRASIAAAWGVKLPIAAALVLWAGLGVLGAWSGLAAEVVVLVIAAAWRFRGGLAARAVPVAAAPAVQA